MSRPSAKAAKSEEAAVQPEGRDRAEGESGGHRRPGAPRVPDAGELIVDGSARGRDADRQLIAVCGAHMSGLPLNAELVKLGGMLATATRTTSDYRLFALDGFSPPRPGLLRVGSNKGAMIDLEVWSLPIEQVGRFLRGISAPLCIGHVALAIGGTVHGFLCEACATETARDITEFGGWRQFLSASA